MCVCGSVSKHLYLIKTVLNVSISHLKIILIYSHQLLDIIPLPPPEILVFKIFIYLFRLFRLFCLFNYLLFIYIGLLLLLFFLLYYCC